MTSEPRILPGASVLPPLDDGRAEPERAEPKRAKANGGGKGNRDRRRTRERFEVLNGFVDAGMAGLTRAELAAWLVLYRDTYTDTGTARTSVAYIARRAGLSGRAIITALASLRRRGLLTRVYRGGLNRGPSVYRVNAVPP